MDESESEELVSLLRRLPPLTRAVARSFLRELAAGECQTEAMTVAWHSLIAGVLRRELAARAGYHRG